MYIERHEHGSVDIDCKVSEAVLVTSSCSVVAAQTSPEHISRDACITSTVKTYHSFSLQSVRCLLHYFVDFSQQLKVVHIL